MAASAQHGGGAHGGFSPPPSAPRGGGAPPARNIPAPGPGRGTPRITFGAPPNRGSFGAQTLFPPPGINYDVGRSLFPPPGVTSTQPLFGSNSNGARRRGGEHERSGYGDVGFVTLGYPSYFGVGNDPEFLEATEKPNDQRNGYVPAGNAYADSYAPAYTGLFAAPPGSRSGYERSSEPAQEPAQPAPPPYEAAPVQATHPAPAKPPAPLPEEEAVTIVFKDGRPPEQIRNYALTRTALYITGARVRTIPVDQIDLAATEMINEKAGVEFHLPSFK